MLLLLEENVFAPSGITFREVATEDHGGGPRNFVTAVGNKG